jgi:hypothetical protein
MDEAMRNAIMEYVRNKTDRGKGLHTVRDIVKACKEFEKRAVKKGVQELIADGDLAYWSSGSTTYIRLAGYEPGNEGLTDGDDE